MNQQDLLDFMDSRINRNLLYYFICSALWIKVIPTCFVTVTSCDKVEEVSELSADAISEIPYTPPRTAIFGLNMMVKSGLEFFILKLNEPLHRYLLTCQANSACLCRCFLHWAAATLKGLIQLKKKYNSRPLFTIILKPKMVISRVKSLFHF